MAKKKSSVVKSGGIKKTSAQGRSSKKKSAGSKASGTKVRGKQSGQARKADPIVIDEKNQLVFADEKELYQFFQPTIDQLEEQFKGQHASTDISVDSFPDFEECLALLLEEPFEIWCDEESVSGQTIYNYIGEFEDEENLESEPIFYVAQVMMVDDAPSFVYLHFPTRDEALVDFYRKGQEIYDISRAVHVPGASDGDALSEGDELAVGLYDAMLKVRSEKDIPEADFPGFFDLREECIEDADEIWQSTDSQGNVLVSFIKEFPDAEVEGFEKDELFYISVTIEEDNSQAHALLFSFPTIDSNLVDRYRQGDNLQAEEVTQQSNH